MQCRAVSSGRGTWASRIQVEHLATGHPLLLSPADGKRVTPDQSIEFMLAEPVSAKKTGMK